MNKTSTTPPTALSPEEIKLITEAIQKKDPWYYHYFMFALHTGMRRSEILALSWHDVDLWKHREITVPNLKRPRHRDPEARHIPINETLLGLLLDLRSQSRWVFQKVGRRMLGGSVTMFFRDLSRLPGIQVNSERIRWTFAANAFNDVAPQTRDDWKKLQRILGHKDLSTTRHYFHRNIGRLPEDATSLVK